MNKTDPIEQSFLRTDLPDFRPGDTVKVHVRVVEGNRERVQVFQGVVIARSGGGIRETFMVRKISFGVGVERTFPLHSPSIAKLELVQRGRVRRAKLYYLRDLRGKKARIKERRVDEAKLAANAEAAAAEAEEADLEPEGSVTDDASSAAPQPDDSAGPSAEEPDGKAVTFEDLEPQAVEGDEAPDDASVGADEPAAEETDEVEERAEA